MRDRRATARLCWATGLGVVVAALGACGGDDGPSAAELRAAKTAWIQKADGACRKATEAISQRGWPADLVDLDRLVVRGAADAREAIRTVTELRIPQGAGPAPGRFVRELRALEPLLGELSSASEDLDEAMLNRVADTLKEPLAKLEDRAEDAGLGDCFLNDERFIVPDAVRAPVFAERMSEIEQSVLRRLQRIQDEVPVRSVKALAGYFENLGNLIDDLERAIDELDPPLWAAQQVSDYQYVLLNMQTVVSDSHTLFSQGAGALTLKKLNRLERRYDKIVVTERKTRKRMLRAVGAGPTLRPEDQPEESRPPEDADVS
jgi:hypothetical protein